MRNLRKVLYTLRDNLEVLKDMDVQIHICKNGVYIHGNEIEQSGVVYYDFKRDFHKATIKINKNAFEYEDDMGILESWERRFKPFLTGLGLEMTEEISMVLLFLHEVGHIQTIRTMYEQDSLFEFERLIVLSIESLSMAFKGEILNMIEDGFNPATYFNFDECQADIFAISHFYPMWNLLKEKGLVK